jgi:hypothetical protein
MENSNSDEAFVNLASRPNAQKVAIVSGHGNEGFICTGNGNHCRALSVFVADSNEMQWTASAKKIDGMFDELMLLSCDTGAEGEGASLLYDIAVLIHRPVIAPTYLVWCGGGKVWLDKAAEWQRATDVGVPAVKHKPHATYEVPKIYKLRIASGWAKVPAGNQTVHAFSYASGRTGSVFVPIDSDLANDLAKRINFAAPFTPGGVPAAVVTAMVTLEINTKTLHFRRQLLIYSDDVVQDAKYRDVFYPIDSRLRDALRVLRRRRLNGKQP